MRNRSGIASGFGGGGEDGLAAGAASGWGVFDEGPCDGSGDSSGAGQGRNRGVGRGRDASGVLHTWWVLEQSTHLRQSVWTELDEEEVRSILPELDKIIPRRPKAAAKPKQTASSAQKQSVRVQYYDDGRLAPALADAGTSDVFAAPDQIMRKHGIDWKRIIYHCLEDIRAESGFDLDAHEIVSGVVADTHYDAAAFANQYRYDIDFQLDFDAADFEAEPKP